MVNISKRKKVERQLYTAKGRAGLPAPRHGLFARARWPARRRPRPADDPRRGTLGRRLAHGCRPRHALAPGRPRRRRPDPDPPLAAGLGLPDGFADRPELAGLAAVATPPRPLAIEDVEAEPEASPWRVAGRAVGFRAVSVVPLASIDGEPLGSIVAAFHGPYRMGERQASLVAMYAARAAEAINAARTLDRLERSNRLKAETLAEFEASLAAILAALGEGAETAREAVEGLVGRLRQLARPGDPPR